MLWQAIKPTVLIGSSGAGKTFTKEVVEAMSSINEKPVILALSNPTSQSECTAEEAYTWSKGRAIFTSGSPFGPAVYEGKSYLSGQANNAYIFPGLGLGLIMSGAIRVHSDILLAVSEALAAAQKGQLGHGDMIQHDRPTIVSELSKHKIVGAATGRSHTVVVTEDGNSYSFGWNKHGQLGSGPVNNVGGQLFMWRKIKNNGDDLMCPKPVMDLRFCYEPCLCNSSRMLLV